MCARLVKSQLVREGGRAKKALEFLVVKKVAALHVILLDGYLERWSVRWGFGSRRWSSADCLIGQ